MNYHPNAKTTIALRKAIRECFLLAGKATDKLRLILTQFINGEEKKKKIYLIEATELA